MRLGTTSSQHSQSEFAYTSKEAPLWYGKEGTLEAYKRVCAVWKLGLDADMQKPEASKQVASLMICRWAKRPGTDPKHVK